MTVQPTPTLGAQPTTPKWAPKAALRAHGAHRAQPSPPNHAASAHWAFYTALGFWATAALVDRVGAHAEGVAGIVLGVGALGVSVAYAHAHDRAVQSARAHLGGAE